MGTKGNMMVLGRKCSSDFVNLKLQFQAPLD